GTVPQHDDVGLGLLILTQDHWILDTDGGLVAGSTHEERSQTVDARRVANADRAHLDDLAVQELHAVILVQHARFAHAVVLVHREASYGERHAHTIHPPRRERQARGTRHDDVGADGPRHPRIAERTFRARRRPGPSL